MTVPVKLHDATSVTSANSYTTPVDVTPGGGVPGSAGDTCPRRAVGLVGA
jgi:hypothetical protein